VPEVFQSVAIPQCAVRDMVTRGRIVLAVELVPSSGGRAASKISREQDVS
jgi:hypothetical protein